MKDEIAKAKKKIFSNLPAKVNIFNWLRKINIQIQFNTL